MWFSKFPNGIFKDSFNVYYVIYFSCITVIYQRNLYINYFATIQFILIFFLYFYRNILPQVNKKEQTMRHDSSKKIFYESY